MSLLGFDAIGRLAIGQNPISGNLPVVYGGWFGIWPPAAPPKNLAKDWVAFSGDYVVQIPHVLPFFTEFSKPPKPPELAKDWIAYSGNEYIEAFPQFGIDFTQFSPGKYAPNSARDWIAYSGSVQIEEFPQFGIDFTTFSPGRAAKMWNGQGPQWWAYYISAPFFPSKRDTHDGWPERWHHGRRPSVYSQEYYDELRRLREKPREDDDDEPIEEIRPVVPNLLIPINRLIPPVVMPSLLQLPPFRPVPTLTNNPPPFHLATPEEMAADDEMIIRMLLEE
jgi:hypothetical protein